MKTKKFEKKLELNKKTIANLSNGQLGLVKGGDKNVPVESESECCGTNTCGSCDTCLTCEATCNTAGCGCTDQTCHPPCVTS
ncbi:MAG: hypothetical protein GTO45_16205 [Candidatus Aminicenantes bacterium]|nr:hypothetical protein [Candidatus Aminicenantes bacterium]NIM83238.1 hypothetical protein [Candidatus Aminicenantes bacterium]NIN19669.1 hypothetical protein [Candidatus Aminicenantes bacterium]NIN43551.1 hypothetical protein [Candidatus Aminicenantes bacterium]NIN86296.1 hypothetical protein [Candidatus Aminicenantes bacterium]